MPHFHRIASSAIFGRKSPVDPLSGGFLVVLLMGLYCGTGLGQAITPPYSEWSDLASQSNHPLARGSASLVSGVLNVAGNVGGSLDENSTSDSGFFKYRPVKEGDYIQVSKGATSTFGVTGTMIRDTLDANSAFVFVGNDETGNRIVLVRRRTGEAIQKIEFDPPGSSLWTKVVVGQSAVYAFESSAAFSNATGHNVWNLLGAFEAELVGEDYGGIYTEEGVGTFGYVFHSKQAIWLDRTGKSENATSSGNPWSTPSPVGTQDPVSDLLKTHPVDASTDYLEIPVAVSCAGELDFYIHQPTGSSSAVTARVMLDGVPQALKTLPNDPSSNAWVHLGTYSTAAAGTHAVRFYTTGGEPGENVIADAVRVVRRQYTGVRYTHWTNTSTNRIKFGSGTNGLANNLVYRDNATNLGWNAGAHSTHALVGDGIIAATVISSDLRIMFGATDAPSGNTNTNIDYRFYATNTGASGKMIVNNGGSTGDHAYGTSDWWVIERIGSQVFFRKNTSIIATSTVPSTQPLYLDASFYDDGGRIRNSRIFGLTVNGANRFDVDGDLSYDSLEQYIYEYDPEDAIQNIVDVNMSDDPDDDDLTHAEEVANNTNPFSSDTDGDGVSDSSEINLSLNPTTYEFDSDGDGIANFVEFKKGLNPLSPHPASPQAGGGASTGILLLTPAN